MEIILYINLSDKNRLFKVLSSPINISGTLKEQTSVTKPAILIEIENPTQYNYAYIPDFGRYYYITDMVSVVSGLWRIAMSVDVLETYHNAILNCSGIISNSETDGYEIYLPSDVWQAKVKSFTDIISFPNGLLDDGEFILITAGG